MKTKYIVLSCLLIFAGLFTLRAQKGFISNVKKEIIPVWGECGMCRQRIEKAAITAGAATASWNENSKILSVAYQASKTNTAKIQQSIATAGYDTRDVTAGNEAYNKLPSCCRYERKEVSAKEIAGSGCSNGMNCSKEAVCCKQDKCARSTCADMTTCNKNGCCKS